jgi:hypothetical protein
MHNSPGLLRHTNGEAEMAGLASLVVARDARVLADDGSLCTASAPNAGRECRRRCVSLARIHSRGRRESKLITMAAAAAAGQAQRQPIGLDGSFRQSVCFSSGETQRRALLLIWRPESVLRISPDLDACIRRCGQGFGLWMVRRRRHCHRAMLETVSPMWRSSGIKPTASTETKIVRERKQR